MLKLLRKQKFAKKIFYLLAIIIVPSFILWGSATTIRDRQQKSYAGKIYGKKISFDEYMSMLNAWRNEIRLKFGDQAYQIEQLLDPNEAVWNKLILLYEAKRLKIEVGNEELTQYITSLPFLQKDGIFDSELYELFLKYSMGIPPRAFEEQIRESLKVRKLYDYITEDVKISDSEIKDRYRQENEQIKVKYISVGFSDLEKEIELTPEEQIEFYRNNADKFSIPIQINLKYIGIDYAKENDEQKEEVDKKIGEIHNLLNKTGDLIQAKDSFNLEIKETGFLTLGEPLPGLELINPKDIIDLFNLRENQISNIIQTLNGPYIFQLKEKHINYLPEFEEIKKNVKDVLIQEKIKELARKKIQDYDSQIKSQKTTSPELNLNKIAKEIGITVNETDFFSRNTPPKEIGYSEGLNEKIFSLKKGGISDPIELAQGYSIIELSEINPIDEKEFQGAKEELQKTLLDEKKDSVFNDYATELKKKANLIDYVSTQQNQASPINSN
ncbi:MAG: SurA N-terminal domain-containing protein [Candidatus Omnitrophota bacterium]